MKNRYGLFWSAVLMAGLSQLSFVGPAHARTLAANPPSEAELAPVVASFDRYVRKQFESASGCDGNQTADFELISAQTNASAQSKVVPPGCGPNQPSLGSYVAGGYQIGKLKVVSPDEVLLPITFEMVGTYSAGMFVANKRVEPVTVTAVLIRDGKRFVVDVLSQRDMPKRVYWPASGIPRSIPAAINDYEEGLRLFCATERDRQQYSRFCENSYENIARLKGTTILPH